MLTRGSLRANACVLLTRNCLRATAYAGMRTRNRLRANAYVQRTCACLSAADARSLGEPGPELGDVGKRAFAALMRSSGLDVLDVALLNFGSVALYTSRPV